MRWERKSDANDWDKIAALIEAALQSPPKDRSLLHRLAIALLSIGKDRKAETQRVLDEMVARVPDDAALRTCLARSHLAASNLSEAKSQVEKALRLDPQSRNARLLKFTMLVRAQDWDDATGMMDEIARLEPLNKSLCEARLRTDAPKSDCESLLAACEANLVRGPALTDAIYYKAIALARLNRGAEAKRTFDLDRFLAITELPAPEGFPDSEIFRAELAEEIKHNPTLVSDYRATLGGLQTRQLRQPGGVCVEALLGQIEIAVDRYANELSGQSCAFYSARPEAARLASWAVVYGPSGRQNPHRHPRGWLSGVFYVAAPRPRGEDRYRGSLVLGQVDSRYGVIEPPWGTKEIEPVPGRLVLFPSYVPHGTEQTSDEGPRISVAFDVISA